MIECAQKVDTTAEHEQVYFWAFVALVCTVLCGGCVYMAAGSFYLALAVCFGLLSIEAMLFTISWAVTEDLKKLKY